MTASSMVPHVEVLIWDKSKERGRYVGHAALRTHTGGFNNQITYISFWPGGCCQTNRSHIHDYSQDETSESTPEDHKMILYGLNIQRINAAFTKFQKSNYEWKLWGSGFFRRSYERNCSGLALYLLEKGGIRDLVPTRVTRDLQRLGLATLITVVVTTVVAFISIRQYRALREQEKHIKDFTENYGSTAFHLGHLYQHVSKIDKIARDLQESSKKYLDPIFVQTHAEAIYSLTQPQMKEDPKLKRDFPFKVGSPFVPSVKSLCYFHQKYANPLVKHIRSSTEHLGFVGALASVSFTVYNLGIANHVVLKTFTPADVKNIARKAELARPARFKIVHAAVISGALLAVGAGVTWLSIRGK